MEQKIIDLANSICQKNFMNYMDYDKDNPLTDLAEAMTVIVSDAFDTYSGVGDGIATDKLYDYFLTQQMNL